MTLKLGVLVSGSGSNLQAILDAIKHDTLDAECRLVVSNKPDAYALTRAREARIPFVALDHKKFAHREAFDRQLVEHLKEAGVECVALAGFMRVLTPLFLESFPNNVVNIHPSLLPAFPGVNAQKQAFDYGVRVTGCTVHFVDNGVDTGPIILQGAVNVEQDDSVENLRDRILKTEHRLFVEGLSLIAQGRVSVKDRRVTIRA